MCIHTQKDTGTAEGEIIEKTASSDIRLNWQEQLWAPFKWELGESSSWIILKGQGLVMLSHVINLISMTCKESSLHPLSQNSRIFFASLDHFETLMRDRLLPAEIHIDRL